MGRKSNYQHAQERYDKLYGKYIPPTDPIVRQLCEEQCEVIIRHAIEEISIEERDKECWLIEQLKRQRVSSAQSQTSF